MEPTQDKTLEQIELEHAQEAVAKAKAKLAEIETARIAKAQADLLADKARKERELFEQREKQRQAEEYWHKRREQERLAREAEQRAEEEKERRLAAEADRLRREKAEREATEKKAKDLAMEAHLLEMEAKRQAEELLRTTPHQEDRTTKHGSASVLNNENLAFEQVRTGKDAANHDTEGRARLFARTATGAEIEYNTTEPVSLPEVPQAPPQSSSYAIVNGRLSDVAFKKLISGFQFTFFLSPATGELCAGMVRWQISGTVDRNWYNGCPCTITQEPDETYSLRQVKGKGVLTIMPASLDPLFTAPEEPALSEAELITVDSTQENQD